MGDVLRAFSPGLLVRAIEDNAAELLMEMGRVGGGEQRDEPGLQWTIGGSPIDYHNCVVRADLDRDHADAAIRLSRERMQARGVPGSWHVGPSMRPPDLPERLPAAGFAFGGRERGMAVDLHALREDLATPADLAIERVRDEGQLSRWAQTLGRGFGEGQREAQWVAQIYRQIGFSDEIPWKHYLAFLGGEPVATSTLFLAAGVAGIYFVMTIPEAQRRGIGAAITLVGLREARRMGYRIGVLGSSEAGHSVYARLGFRDYCAIAVDEWVLPDDDGAGA